MLPRISTLSQITLANLVSQLVRCPKCQTQLQLPEGSAGKQFACPKCGQTLAAPSRPNAGLTAAPHNPVTTPSKPGRPPGTRKPRAGGNRSKKTSGQSPPGLQPFLRHWMIGLGAVCVFAILLGIAGFFSELAALGSAVVSALATLVCVFWGRFWIAIMLGRKKTVEGALAVFIPLVGVVMAAQRKGELLKGLIVYVSAIVPCLLGLAAIGLFRPGDRPSRSAARFADSQQKAAQRIGEIEQTLAKSPDVFTVEYKLAGLQRDKINFVNGAEAELKNFKHYEPASFSADDMYSRATLKHRGNKDISLWYKFYLGGRFKVFLTIDKDDSP